MLQCPHRYKYKHKYKYKCRHKNQSVLGVVEGVSSSPAVLHHNPGALATTRLPLDTHQQLFLIVMVMMMKIMIVIMVIYKIHLP